MGTADTAQRRHRQGATYSDGTGASATRSSRSWPSRLSAARQELISAPRQARRVRRGAARARGARARGDRRIMAGVPRLERRPGAGLRVAGSAPRKPLAPTTPAQARRRAARRAWLCSRTRVPRRALRLRGAPAPRALEGRLPEPASPGRGDPALGHAAGGAPRPGASGTGRDSSRRCRSAVRQARPRRRTRAGPRWRGRARTAVARGRGGGAHRRPRRGRSPRGSPVQDGSARAAMRPRPSPRPAR